VPLLVIVLFSGLLDRFWGAGFLTTSFGWKTLFFQRVFPYRYFEKSPTNTVRGGVRSPQFRGAESLEKVSATKG
jgi:hypothetical protein